MGPIYQRAAGSWKAISMKDVGEWEGKWQMRCCLTPQQQQVHCCKLCLHGNQSLARSMNKPC